MKVTKSSLKEILLTLNLINIVTGFVWLSFINTSQFSEISTINYRILTAILSLLSILVCLLISNTKLYFNKINKFIFLYYIFAFFYLIKIIIDTIFIGNYSQVFDGSAVLFLVTTATFIILQPTSILFLNKKLLLQISKNLPYIFAVPFVLNVILNIGFNHVTTVERESIFIGIGPNNLGFLSSMLLSYYLLQVTDNKLDVRNKIIGCIISFFAFFIMSTTATKSGFLSTAIILGIFLYIKKKNFLTIKFYIYSTIFIFFLFYTSSLWYPWVDLLIWRFEYTMDKGDSGRLYLWTNALQMFLSSPIFGNSFVIPSGGFFHNFFLDALVTTGFLGGIIFIIMNIVAFRISINALKHDLLYSFIPIAYMTIFITGMFSSNLFSNWLYWIFLLLVLKLNHGSNFKKTKITVNTNMKFIC